MSRIHYSGGMYMPKRMLLWSEISGAVAVYAAAVFLHFAYAISGGSALWMVFGAVNESVWEHVKIYSEAYTLWALLQLCWIKVPFRRYAVAKCVGLYLLMGLMIGFFYTYTAFTGRSILLIDILSSVVFTTLSQAVSYLLTVKGEKLEEYYHPALMLLLLYYLMFFSFTVFPPKLGLFRDPLGGGYGIAGLRVV